MSTPNTCGAEPPDGVCYKRPCAWESRKDAPVCPLAIGEWVTVPREPTQEMLYAFEGTIIEEGRKGPGAGKKGYAALIAAAPQPAVKSSGGEPMREAVLRCVDRLIGIAKASPFWQTADGQADKQWLLDLAQEIRALPPTPVTSSEAAIIERCAKVADEIGDSYGEDEARWLECSETIAAHIRALAPLPAASREGFDFLAHLARQAAWSSKTFGPGHRTLGVIDHIRKELLEIEADPLDLKEWIDVVILGLDGAWRTGATPQQIIDRIDATQTRNEGRVWPDWHTMPADKAIEHDRSAERSALVQSTSPEAAGMVVSEALVEAAAKAYAEATGYYVQFHAGLRSESADKIRKGVRAALSASEPHADERGKL